MTNLIPLQHRFVFIGGLHRSGTSLLHSILRSHNQISGFENTGVCEDEGQHLQTVYPTAKKLGGPGKFGFRLESHMDEAHPLVTDKSLETLWQEWSSHWDLSKDYLLEKSPPNLLRTRFLQALFPKSTFIIILRHPIVTAYATQKWSKTSIPSLIDHSLRCYESFQQDREHLKNVYVFRYEDFVLQPQQHINNLLMSMGLEPHPIQHHVRSNANEKYLKQWQQDQQAALTHFFYSWSGQWMKFEQRANAFGYTLVEPNQLLSAAPYELPLMAV